MSWGDEPENKEWNVEEMRFLFVQDASGRTEGYKGGMRRRWWGEMELVDATDKEWGESGKRVEGESESESESVCVGEKGQDKHKLSENNIESNNVCMTLEVGPTSNNRDTGQISRAMSRQLSPRPTDALEKQKKWVSPDFV